MGLFDRSRADRAGKKWGVRSGPPTGRRRAASRVVGAILGSVLVAVAGGSSALTVPVRVTVCIEDHKLIDMRLCFPQVLSVTFATDHGHESGAQRHAELQAPVGVPTPLDVDGKPGPDVTARIGLEGIGRYVLEINKTATAAAYLPLRVAAILKDPSGSTGRYVLGYDTRSSTAPAEFSTVIRPTVTEAGTNLAATISTRGAGERLSLIGQIHRAGANEAIVDPTSASVRFSPVPTAITADLTFPPQTAASRRTKVSLTTDALTKIVVEGQSVRGPRTTSFDGTVESLKGTATVTVDERAGDATTYDYRGPDGVGGVHVHLHDNVGIATGPQGRAPAHDLDVVVTDLPSRITATLAPADGVTMLRAEDASGQLDTIGSVVARLSSSDALAPADQAVVDSWEGRDGVLVRDLADRFTVFGRVTKLRSVGAKLDGDEPDVTLRTGSATDTKYDVQMVAEGDYVQSFTGHIKRRPTCVRFAVAASRPSPDATCSGHGEVVLRSPPAGSRTKAVLYEASSRANEVTLFANISRELTIGVTLVDLPQRIEAVVSTDGPLAIDVGTLDPVTGEPSQIGTVALTMGAENAAPHRTVASSADHVTITKHGLIRGQQLRRADVTAVRLTGLRSASVRTEPSLDAAVDVIPSGKAFIFDSSIDEPAKNADGTDATWHGQPIFTRRQLQAELGALSSRMSLKLGAEGGDGRRLSYAADQDVASLNFLQTARDYTFADGFFLEAGEHATLSAAPLPSIVDVCFRPAGPACGLDAWTGSELTTRPNVIQNGPHPQGTTLVVDASSPTTVNATFCLAPHSPPFGGCEPPRSGEPDRRFRVAITDARAQTLRVQASSLIIHEDGAKLSQDLPLIFLDTDNRSVSGAFKVYLPPAQNQKFNEIQGFFPDVPAFSFKAQDRRIRARQFVVVELDHAYPGAPNRTGTVVCPSDMTIGLEGGLWGIGGADLKGVIC